MITSLMLEFQADFLICCRDIKSVQQMLKSRKNIHAGLFRTISKFGYFLALKYMLILT
jgi:hypothetical protein